MVSVTANIELSKMLGESGGYTPKRCYDNVFNNMGKIGYHFKDDDIKVMFCYVSVGGNMSNVYTRHACYYLNGEAIDPTLAVALGDRFYGSELNYIPLKIMGIDEYFSLISREQNTDLTRTLMQYERKICSTIFDQGGIPIG